VHVAIADRCENVEAPGEFREQGGKNEG